MVQPLRACILTPNFTQGGAERWIVDLIKHTDPRRVLWTGVALVGWSGADRDLTRELSACCPIYAMEHLATAHPLSGVPFCADYLKLLPGNDCRAAVDAVLRDSDVSLAWGTFQVSNWIERHSGKPHVFCSHAEKGDFSSKSVGRFTHLTAVARMAVRLFEGREGADRLPLHVLYNGSDPSRVVSDPIIRRDLRAVWGASPRDIVIGCLSRQVPIKNPGAAALAAYTAGPGHFVVYYGKGPDQRQPDPLLREWCEEYLPGRCFFSPWVWKVGDVLAAIDVFMLASREEAFSLGLIDAWLTGVPVVATRVGAIPELEDKFGPLVFPVAQDATCDELAAAVGEAMADRGRRAAYAKKIAMRHFTVRAMCRRWEDYLEAVVRGDL